MSKNIGIIGAGSWGIALAKLLYNNGNEVTVWSALEDEIKMLNEKREHVDKLPGVKLPDEMIFTSDLKEEIFIPSPSLVHVYEIHITQSSLTVIYRYIYFTLLTPNTQAQKLIFDCPAMLTHSSQNSSSRVFPSALHIALQRLMVGLYAVAPYSTRRPRVTK